MTERYLASVRELPCAVCGAPPRSFAHHPRFAAGMATKAADRLAISLCYACHQGDHGIHGDRSRWRLYGVDEPAALARTLELRFPY